MINKQEIEKLWKEDAMEQRVLWLCEELFKEREAYRKAFKEYMESNESIGKDMHWFKQVDDLAESYLKNG